MSVLKAGFPLANKFARIEFFFCLLHGLSTVTNEKPIQFMQRNVDFTRIYSQVENWLKRGFTLGAKCPALDFFLLS